MPKIYRMTRVTFGVVSSPFLAIGTIQEHVRRCKETFPVASSEILRSTYVHDFASGRDNMQETLKLQQSATELMQKAASNLTKWSSNSSERMDAIPRLYPRGTEQQLVLSTYKVVWQKHIQSQKH